MILNSQKLKQIRQDKGWSQDLLAKSSGLSLRTIQRIESDAQASSESLLAIASALELSPALLRASSNELSFNITRKTIIHSLIGFMIIALAVTMLMLLSGGFALFTDGYGLIFLIAFISAATIVAFGVDGLIKSMTGFKCLFSQQIAGGNPAKYLANIYQSQIRFCYGGAIVAFFIGMVAIHGNLDFKAPKDIHRAYSINLLLLVYATLICEMILRPLKIKLSTCDLSDTDTLQ
ncbi:MAG: helix-turn-helix domain-containing protein [Gammaproteobacteria bacterium]|nr:helix-turn-helix domain-containing protein [Gammaproteobacteria bacterium]MBU2425504.1 helix-turn-helix domain-containing protein [Gammaproteobacteria bacterium]